MKEGTKEYCKYKVGKFRHILKSPEAQNDSNIRQAIIIIIKSYEKKIREKDYT